MSKTTEKVRVLAEPIAEKQGLEIWDIEYVREAGTQYLRVYIDKQGGVSINDCEAFSRALDPILDEHDPIPESYVFEVSSAGLERELKRPSDFERFMGADVEVKLYSAKDGKKAVTGKLKGYSGGDVTLDANGSEILLKKAEIACTRLRATI